MTAFETVNLGAVGYLGSPVLGPGGEVAGVLAMMSDKPVVWNALSIERAENLAYLLNQLIMFRASMETLRMIASERHAVV